MTVHPETSPDDALDFEALYRIAQRRYEREQRARKQAESIAEHGLRMIHLRERQAALLESVARAANSSTSWEQTIRIAMQEVCEHAGWSCGFVYIWDDKASNVLTLSPCHVVMGEGLESFVDFTLTRFEPAGRTLPGRAATLGKPVWISDVTNDCEFPRKQSAVECGLRTGVSVPILIDDKVVAVTEFFGREVQNPDISFLGVLDTIGVQLGRVIERERIQAKLLHDSTHDALTGLPNRGHLINRLTRCIAQAHTSEATYAVLFVDLDRFKLINDSLGHRAGDALLIEIATRFRSVIAPRGQEAMLARLGGDEFVVLVQNLNGIEAATSVAESLLAAMAMPVRIEGQQIFASASIGVTVGLFGYKSADDALRDADIAMYEAKRGGKSRVSIFEPVLHLQAVSRLALESDLRRALRDRQFLLHYQPIVPTSAAGHHSFEALLRWQKAPGLIVAPGEFINVAEESGLIVFIGEFVLREACNAAKLWNHDRPANEWISVSVNMSARQIAQPDLVQMVERTIVESGAHPEMLSIELTESLAVTNFDLTSSKLAAIRALGVKVSIDDFGTGHSSLSYLHQLKFDTIKIDRSFVQSICDDADSGRIIQTVLDLAKNLDVSVVAEGAETHEQLDSLRRMGCDYIQGYYISRPLDEEAAGRWVHALRTSPELRRAQGGV